MGFILSILSSILEWVFQPLMWTYGQIRSATKGEWNKYNMDLAKSKDKYGNVLGQYVFNDILIKPYGYKYGNGNETISSATGKNKVRGTFRKLGRFFDAVLEKFEKNHSIKSIDNSIK